MCILCNFEAKFRVLQVIWSDKKVKIRRNGLRPLANVEAGATLPKEQKPRVAAYTKTLATTRRKKKRT